MEGSGGSGIGGDAYEVEMESQLESLRQNGFEYEDISPTTTELLDSNHLDAVAVEERNDEYGDDEDG